MRIAFLATELGGGIGTNLLRLINYLHKRGETVFLWAEDPDFRYGKEVDEGVLKRKLTTSHPITSPSCVALWIIKDKVDVIVTPNERLSRVAFYAKKLSSKFHKTAVVAQIHNLYTKEYAGIGLKKLRKRKKRFEAIYPRLDGVIAVSNAAKNDFFKFALLSPEQINIVTIYNPVVTNDMLNTVSLCDDLPSLDQKPIVLTVGRLCQQKNLKLLIDSFNVLRSKVDCKLIIIGDGSEYENVNALKYHSPFTNDIELLGHKYSPFEEMRRANVFALTSDFEGFGNVVAESLFCGTPVVSTDSGGPKEIIVNSRLGKITASSPSEIADDLEAFLESDSNDLYRRQYAIDRFSVEAIAEQYINYFREILKRD